MEKLTLKRACEVVQEYMRGKLKRGIVYLMDINSDNKNRYNEIHALEDLDSPNILITRHIRREHSRLLKLIGMRRVVQPHEEIYMPSSSGGKRKLRAGVCTKVRTYRDFQLNLVKASEKPDTPDKQDKHFIKYSLKYNSVPDVQDTFDCDDLIFLNAICEHNYCFENKNTKKRNVIPPSVLGPPNSVASESQSLEMSSSGETLEEAEEVRQAHITNGPDDDLRSTYTTPEKLIHLFVSLPLTQAYCGKLEYEEHTGREEVVPVDLDDGSLSGKGTIEGHYAIGQDIPRRFLSSENVRVSIDTVHLLNGVVPDYELSPSISISLRELFVPTEDIQMIRDAINHFS